MSKVDYQNKVLPKKNKIKEKKTEFRFIGPQIRGSMLHTGHSNQ